jgi:hypothetical protein
MYVPKQHLDTNTTDNVFTGANSMIVSYSASAVKIYNASSNLERLESIFSPVQVGKTL